MTTDKKWLLKLLLSLRWIPVCFIVLPLSTWMRLWGKWKLRSSSRLLGSVAVHGERVKRVQEQVKLLGAISGDGLCTARPSRDQMSMRVNRYKGCRNTVSLSELNGIVALERDPQLVRVEPGCSIKQLTSFLQPRRLTLPVVPELDELTIGGLVSGYGIETSSHVHGLFFDCVLAVDVVVASGELVRCSPTENADLFYALSWSLGSLGFVVSVDLRVQEAKPFVRLTYSPCSSRRELIAQLERLTTCAQRPEVVEAIMFDAERSVLMTGDFSDNADRLPVNTLPWNSEWFYKQVEADLKRGTPRTEAMELNAYYHRHTRSLFWEMELILPFGNHWLFRHLFGWLMPVSISLLKLTNTETLQRFYEESHCAQDFLVPLSRLEESLALAHEQFEVYPVWLCPHKVARTEPQGAVRFGRPGLPVYREASGEEYHMFFDIGLYGVSGAAKRGERWSAPEAVARYERFLIEIGGYSALYAIVELNRPQFDQMFDRQLYGQMRKKWDPESKLLDCFEKVRKK
jgi:delta24-sterol reductase